MSFVVAAFYHFTDFPDYQDAKSLLEDFCNKKGLKGTILVSREGLNSTISGTKEGIQELKELLLSDSRFSPIESWKETQAESIPFSKMKVRLKKELVALGIGDLDMSSRGEYIEPEDWDDFVSSEEVHLIDTRNDYEIKYGTFLNAIDPNTRTFREFPSWMEKWANGKDKKNTKIAMVCTGGIRCEKSTSYVKNVLGFEHVYHLKGGILRYLEKLSANAKTWKGSCFVFDNRVALDNSLNPVPYIFCTSCNTQIPSDNTKEYTKNCFLCAECNTDSETLL